MTTWAEMDDKARVRLILQHVMGCFVLDITATGWHTPEHPRGREVAAPGFHWPIAFWNTDGECWMMRDAVTDPTPFVPLHDMNDAWLSEYIRVNFCFRNVTNAGKGPWDHYYAEVATAPEAICLAALRAVGIEAEKDTE